MKRSLTLLLLTAAFLLAACGKATPTAASEDPQLPDLSIPQHTATGPMEITNPDQPIEVKTGEEFMITLETNPNSGLHWEVAVELDTAVVDYVWKDFVSKTEREDSPGWDVWTFKAVAPGQTTITLGYYRGFTEDASKTVVFTVIVK